MNRPAKNAWITVAVLFSAAAILFAISFVGGRAATPAAPAPAAAAPPAAVGLSTRPASTAAPRPGVTAAPAAPAGAVTTASGLQYIDNVTGTGPKPQKGQTVVVHYTGYLDNGTVFDSSRQRNQPFEFVIGTGAVIKGWDEGVATMNVGGQRRLIVPPALGYGAAGAGSGRIPPNSRLTFDVELIAIK
ncbi:MAG: FKBP-type peptidyl-prolyl cis-trans isomerase [Thermoflexales bacterium]